MLTFECCTQFVAHLAVPALFHVHAVRVSPRRALIAARAILIGLHTPTAHPALALVGVGELARGALAARRDPKASNTHPSALAPLALTRPRVQERAGAANESGR